MYNLLNDSTLSKFVTRKCIKVNYLLGGQYSVSKNIILETPILRSDFYDYNMYIVMKGTILIINTLIDNAEDLDTAMPLYNW